MVGNFFSCLHYYLGDPTEASLYDQQTLASIGDVVSPVLESAVHLILSPVVTFVCGAIFEVCHCPECFQRKLVQQCFQAHRRGKKQQKRDDGWAGK